MDEIRPKSQNMSKQYEWQIWNSQATSFFLDVHLCWANINIWCDRKKRKNAQQQQYFLKEVKSSCYFLLSPKHGLVRSGWRKAQKCPKWRGKKTKISALLSNFYITIRITCFRFKYHTYSICNDHHLDCLRVGDNFWISKVSNSFLTIMFLLMFLNRYEWRFWHETSITVFGNVNKMLEMDMYT